MISGAIEEMTHKVAIRLKNQEAIKDQVPLNLMRGYSL